MINDSDILDMCCLTRDQVQALAAHDHTDPVSTAEHAEYLMHLHHGPQEVQKSLCSDIAQALHQHDLSRARALFATLRDFVAQHPAALRGNY